MCLWGIILLYIKLYLEDYGELSFNLRSSTSFKTKISKKLTSFYELINGFPSSKKSYVI